jgi:hypothetical protein
LCHPKCVSCIKEAEEKNQLQVGCKTPLVDKEVPSEMRDGRKLWEKEEAVKSFYNIQHK